MHTIIITDEAPLAASKPVFVPDAVVTVETGDHIVITRKVERETHRNALRTMLAEMNRRAFNPALETAADVLKEVRRGG